MKTNTVYWATWAPNRAESLSANILFGEPVSVLKDLSSTYKGASFIQCPAFIDYCKNLYVIKAQMDITFSYDTENDWMRSSLNSQEFYDEFAIFDGIEQEVNGSRRITVPSRYVFYSKDEMMIEAIPPFLQGHSIPTNFNLVPGTFDISKWIRPVECTGVMVDTKNPLKIKRGDALLYLKFIPKDKGKVTLEQELMTEDLARISLSCTSVKSVIPNIPLATLYKMAEPIMAAFKKSKRSKCPFSRFWK